MCEKNGKIEVTDEIRNAIYTVIKAYSIDSDYITRRDFILDEIAAAVITEVEAVGPRNFG